MATALFADAGLIYFDDDVITIIRNIKKHHQRAEYYSQQDHQHSKLS